MFSATPVCVRLRSAPEKPNRTVPVGADIIRPEKIQPCKKEDLNMDFLKNNRRISLLYDGKSIEKASFKITQTVEKNTVATIYEHPDGLKITNIARKIEKFGAYEWVNYLENTSSEPTKLITELCDCDCALPLPPEEKRKWEAYFGDGETDTKIYAPYGSEWKFDEFYADVDKIVVNNRINHIFLGEQKEYTTDTGRSSDTQAPFFNIHKNGEGMIFAIGWTGKWRCILNRNDESIRIRTKVDDTSFRLYGGEKIRTSSIVLMPYRSSVIDSQNKWRRLVKEEFSLMGTPGRDKYGPLCANIWGGMKTASVLERIEKIKENNLPYEYVWMDAGWYGEDTAPTPDEFEGDWHTHTGDWRISKKIHPNELADVSAAVHSAGMKFLLWFEPERVIKSTPIVREHPEYFLGSDYDGDNNLLLNLGFPEAWNYCFETLSGLIEKLGIDCYRQDFNFDPLHYWRKNDWADRKGMTEIKHINGLYRLWDALLERFPHLIIDDCSSGGRRIDIEMLKRSMPMWRSDVQCPADYPDYMSQCHNLNYNTWMPYSGTGTGRLYDMYRVRSAYGASLATNYSFSERAPFAETSEKVEFIKKFTNEYLTVRPYFSEDFYPLTEMSDKLDVWCAAQFDRPSEKDGMIQVFRRENSPCPKAEFNLFNIDENAVYTFTDIDTGDKTEISGKDLKEKGFAVEIPKRCAKIYLYNR